LRSVRLTSERSDEVSDASRNQVGRPKHPTDNSPRAIFWDPRWGFETRRALPGFAAGVRRRSSTSSLIAPGFAVRALGNVRRALIGMSDKGPSLDDRETKVSPRRRPVLVTLPVDRADSSDPDDLATWPPQPLVGKPPRHCTDLRLRPIPLLPEEEREESSMAWNPTATRAFATFLFTYFGFRRVLHRVAPLLHKSGPDLHRSREHLWTAWFRRGRLGTRSRAAGRGGQGTTHEDRDGVLEDRRRARAGDHRDQVHHEQSGGRLPDRT
jgi:hypothetical protein